MLTSITLSVYASRSSGRARSVLEGIGFRPCEVRSGTAETGRACAATADPITRGRTFTAFAAARAFLLG